jgi:hypothetical protein
VSLHLRAKGGVAPASVHGFAGVKINTHHISSTYLFHLATVSVFIVYTVVLYVSDPRACSQLSTDKYMSHFHCFFFIIYVSDKALHNMTFLDYWMYYKLPT